MDAYVSPLLHIDFDKLREQKSELLRTLIERDNLEDSLYGIVYILDAIQDYAAERFGDIAIFGDLDKESD